MFGILLRVIVKYFVSIMDDSVIRCDEVIGSYDEEINFNEKKTICKTHKFYILLTFLLITIALLIAVSIYCYLLKNLLPFHNTNNKLNRFYVDSIKK